ncbi:MAG TPA: dTDP-4-dehydrorhamnose 3,5-epimerase [bacterium]|nr:dTDP-4-dehydrorhamnose 3,5-epimerase [bacterium]
MPFQFQRLTIQDVILIEPKVFNDDRGFFIETYKQSEFRAFGIQESFVQDNHSHSTRGVLRGLHYQLNPGAQAKLVRVIHGEIWDVAVDIRKGSPSFGCWVGEKLSAENARLMYIPKGFAHGFCVLSHVADILYKVTEEWSPEFERGIIWNDPEIKINWGVSEPILSSKDQQLPLLKDAENNFVFKL